MCGSPCHTLSPGRHASSCSSQCPPRACRRPHCVSFAHVPRSYFAKDLTATNFGATVGFSEDRYMVVNFYMPYSPHCQSFAARYERLAQSFNTQDSDVVVTRVNCLWGTGSCAIAERTADDDALRRTPPRAALHSRRPPLLRLLLLVAARRL